MAAAKPPSIGHKILADTGKLLTSSVWSRVLAFAVGMITARVLGPADFGLLKVISFVPSLSKFGGFGFDAVARREIPHLRGKGAPTSEEEMVRNVSFSADMLWSLVLSLAVFASSFWFANPLVRYGLWIAAVTLVAVKYERLLSTFCAVDKKFGVIAMAGAIGTGVGSLATVSTIWWGGIYSVLGGTLVGGLSAIWWYRRKAREGFTWTLEPKELRRQFWLAVPLAGGTIAFGVLGWVERVEVLALFGREQLGIYMLTVTLYEYSALFTNIVLRATAIHVYERLGREGEVHANAGLILKPSLIFAYALPMVGGLLWICGPYLVMLFLPAYEQVIPLLPWICVMLTVRGISVMHITAMSSARLNMQWMVVVVFLGTSAIFAGLTWAGQQWGWGLLSPVMAKTVAFAALTLFTCLYTAPVFFRRFAEVFPFLAQAALPVAFVVAVILGLQHLWPSHGLGPVAGKALVFMTAYAPLLYLLNRQTGLISAMAEHLSSITKTQRP